MRKEESGEGNEERIKEGDWIVHKQHGVGQVKAIEEKKIGEKGRKYFRVKVSRGVYWLPIKVIPGYVRLISSRYRILEVLKLIGKAPQELPGNYSERNQYIADKLNEVRIRTKGEMLRDLHARGPKDDANLTVVDGRNLDKLREQFLREMVVVLDIDIATAEEKLDRALRKSVEKMKKSEKEKIGEAKEDVL